MQRLREEAKANVGGVSDEMAARLEEAAAEAEQQLENERRTLMKQMSLLENELQVSVHFAEHSLRNILSSKI